MRRAFAIVPLLSTVMLSTGRPDNYFSCTMFPGPEGTQGQLTFAVRYAVSPAGAEQVVLLVSDQATYPCMNYQLESGLSVAGQDILVSMSGRILKPDVCLTATGPAQYQTALPIAPGTYSLEFARSGAVDRYRLTVTATAIAISTIESSFTRPM
ncbi:MAG TPA: hypothetical protein VMR92_00410 [Gemmatimonadales bacterium]|jgi:hypothetical protein|nr:hypothetical protein [Gemmatimonadales bacterium]